MVVILHSLTVHTHEKPSLVKLLTDCSEAMPRQQKYQNPQAAKERKKTKREGGHRGKVLDENQFLQLKWILPNNRGGKKIAKLTNLSQMT